MDIHEAAKRLDGNEYGSEGSKELFAEMKANRLVAVFGASDDLMEVRGAVDDEYGTGPIYFDGRGEIINECDNDECPHYAQLIKGAPSVEANFDDEGYTFTYKTTIPHATFDIMEDGDKYCRGIVFSLDNLSA